MMEQALIVSSGATNQHTYELGGEKFRLELL